MYLYVARSRSRLELLGLALLGLVKDVKQTSHLDCRALSAFTIETQGKAVPVYLDGEVTVLQPPLHYRVRPRELRVIVPLLDA